MADDSTVVADSTPHTNPINAPPPPTVEREPSESKPIRLQSGCVVANRFVIQKFLGKGGMGDVYEAEDLHLHHARVALKTIRAEHVWSPTMRDRFRQEVLLARSIAHPNVCPVYEMFSAFGAEGEIWFLTMKLLSGETLATRIRRLGPLTPADTVRFANEIASALDSAHMGGVIHRDLKPGNIFLESYISGVRAVVTDFGLARNWGEGPWSADLGGVVGTPAYIAPEVRAGEAANPRSDVYAFGIVLHEMLWGVRPGVDQERARDAAEQRMHKVVIRCICAEPTLRYASAGEAAEALERAWNRGRRVFTRREVMLEGAALVAATLGMIEYGPRDGKDIERLLHPVPRPRRVAVMADHQDLPLREASLMSGIVESVSTNLSRAETNERDLFVVPPRMLAEQKVSDPAKVAGLFGANLVLETTLEQTQREIRVDLRLMDCKSGRVIRKRSVTCEIAALYELPLRTTEQAASLLDVREPKSLTQQVARGGTDKPDAFLAFERGRDSLRSADPRDVERAIEQLERAVEVDGRFALAYALLAEAYVTKYRHVQEPAALEMAEENVKRCRTLEPNLARGYVSQALIERARGQYSAAEANLKKAISLDNEDTLAPLTLAEIYHEAGQPDLASGAYEALLRQHPNLWPAILDWADLFEETGNLKRAEQLLKRATVAAPNAFLPWRELGALYIYLGQLDKAEASLNQSIKLFPSGGAYNNLGIILSWQGRYEEAARTLEKAVDLNPRSALMWSSLGDAYSRVNTKHAQAVRAYRTAVALASDAAAVNPNGRDQIVDLALYQAKAGDREAATTSLKRVEKMPAPNLNQLFTEACTNELIGNRDLALQQVAACVRRGYSKVDISRAPELAELRKDARFRQLGLTRP